MRILLLLIFIRLKTFNPNGGRNAVRHINIEIHLWSGGAKVFKFIVIIKSFHFLLTGLDEIVQIIGSAPRTGTELQYH